MRDYCKYINALRKCAKEHKNDRTFTGHIITSDLCQDTANLLERLEKEPCEEPQTKIGQCKDCKYFEYDSWANVNGIPIIVAHEICSKWGNGCKTKKDGYCFMFERQENEG